MTNAMPLPRPALRQQLLAHREAFANGPEAIIAAAELARHLSGILRQLEPELLGLYWPYRSEFNAVAAIRADSTLATLPLALPFARRAPAEMHYRAWNGQAPTLRDDCGIPACEGAPVVPDVLLVPCVGFTAEGFRLGYGGGYFDRWLALHPGVTTIGVAWSASEIATGGFDAQPHDLAMTLVVTEHGVA
jgi:5-formyltetrahydrofolate cyclo-ligase